jgi:hypothetical protein
MTMSWVDEANAATSAITPNATRPPSGLRIAMPTSAAITVICASAIQPRRRPSQRPSRGASTLSMTGAQRNFSE